jgi:predicted alpha/beta hydrolase
MGEKVRIPARGDGFPLGGELFLPEGPPKAVVLIAGAMAVRASFYAPLASHVAAQGAAALIVDYRGIGASRPPGRLQDFQATFHDWGVSDLAGACDWLAERFRQLPLLWVGHSAGGQLMGLVHPTPVRAALFIAAGTAWWKGYRGLPRALMLSLWYAIFPVTLALAGYLPMRRFRQGDDVPVGVAKEWAQWGRDPRYVFSYAEPRGGMGYTAYSGPLLATPSPTIRTRPRGRPCTCSRSIPQRSRSSGSSPPPGRRLATSASSAGPTFGRCLCAGSSSADVPEALRP